PCGGRTQLEESTRHTAIDAAPPRCWSGRRTRRGERGRTRCGYGRDDTAVGTRNETGGIPARGADGNTTRRAFCRSFSAELRSDRQGLGHWERLRWEEHTSELQYTDPLI